MENKSPNRIKEIKVQIEIEESKLAEKKALLRPRCKIAVKK